MKIGNNFNSTNNKTNNTSFKMNFDPATIQQLKKINTLKSIDTIDILGLVLLEGNRHTSDLMVRIKNLSSTGFFGFFKKPVKIEVASRDSKNVWQKLPEAFDAEGKTVRERFKRTIALLEHKDFAPAAREALAKR